MESIINLTQAWSHIQYETLKDSLNKKSFKQGSGKEEEIANEIRTNGIAVLPNYYSEEKCDKLIKEFERIIIEAKANIWQDDSKSDTRIYGSHLYSDLIKEYYNDSFLKEIGERYLESELINSHTLSAKLVPKENNLGSGGGWHRDSVFKKQYKSILYLTDVKPENGPFEYALKTHIKSSIYTSIKNNGFKADQNRISNELVDAFMDKNPEFKKQINTATKGTVILVDTGGIHRGIPIKEGSRFALTNYFFPKHHYTESQKKKFETLF